MAVNGRNYAPVITSVAPTTVFDDETYTYQVIAADVNEGDTLTYSTIQAPANMIVQPSGSITWSPGIVNVGTHVVIVHVTDQLGEIGEQVFELTVLEKNRVPQITSQAPTTSLLNEQYSYQLVATDENEADTISFSLTQNPENMIISNSGLITWSASELGVFQVVVRATDSQSTFDEQAFSISVIEEGTSYNLTFTSEPVEYVKAGGLYEYQAVASADSQTTVTYSIIVGPLEMLIGQQSGLVTWSPLGDDVGSNPVTIKALDELGNSVEQKFTVKVSAGLIAPRIVSVPELTVLEGKKYEYLVNVDPDATDYQYSLKSSSENGVIDSLGRINWLPESGLVGSMLNENNLCSVQPADTAGFDPVLKWHWSGGQVRHTPLVGQLSDDNEDGVVNTLDNPDVVFIAYEGEEFDDGWLVVLDGGTGLPVDTFVSPEEKFHAYSHIAIGDIDKDGQVEIITMTSNGYLVAYDHTGGAPIWSKEMPKSIAIRTIPSLYDLDGDGDVEILMGKYIFHSDGELWWEGEGDSSGGGTACSCMSSRAGRPNTDMTSFAMDFLPFWAGQEVIVGDQVYSAKGKLIWTAEGAGDGFSAMGDLDGDGDAELVIVNLKTYTVSVVDRNGKLVWSDKYNESAGGPPTLADINGDGFLEIGFVGKKFYYAYSHTGELLWKTAIQDNSSGLTGSTVFDFEGDGRADIVYFDEEFLRVFDENGEAKFKIANNSGTWIEYPVIADLDKDGHADILIPSSDSNAVKGENNLTKGVSAFQDRYNSWPATRSIWNQHAYHIDNVNDDGTIPRIPAKSFQTHNTFRLSAFPNRSGQEQMDIVLSKLRLEPVENNSVNLVVDLQNRTNVDVLDNITVSFYHGEPSEGGVFLGEVSVPALDKYTSVALSINDVDTSLWVKHIVAVISYSGYTPECVSDNNAITGVYFKVDVSDSRGREDSQEFIVTVENSNRAPVISSSSPGSVIAGQQYTYQVVATDVDLGDVIDFSLINPPAGMRVNARDGLVVWTPTNQEVGPNEVVIRATDNSGSFVEQVYVLTVELNDQENRPPYIANVTTLFARASSSLSYTLASIDPDGDEFTYEVIEGPGNTRISGNRIYWYPRAQTPVYEAGLYEITVRVTDEHGLWTESVFPVWLTEATVNPDEVELPEIVIEQKELVFIVGQTSSYALPLPDGTDSFEYELVSGPGSLKVEDDVIIWKPWIWNWGSHDVVVKLTDGTISYQYSFVASVRNTENRHPILDGGFPGQFYINEPVEFQFSYSDPDGDDVTFTVVEKPTNAMISQDGLLKWMPTNNEIGSQKIVIVLDDTVGALSTNTISFEVLEFRNRTPFFTQMSPPSFAAVGAPYDYQFIASDLDGDTLIYSVVSGPTGMVINSAGLLSIPDVTLDLVDDYDVMVRVTDEVGASSTVTYSLSISDNTAPQFTTAPSQAAYVGDIYWYGPRATDLEGHDFTFSLLNAPDGVEMDPDSGEVSWTPAEEQIGESSVQITVTDIFGESSQQTFSIQVYSAQIMYRNVCPAPSSL